MSAAVHVPNEWLLSALRQIDRTQGDAEIGMAVRAARGLLSAVGLSFDALGRLLLQEVPPYLQDDAPLTLDNISKLMSAHYYAVPMACVPPLGEAIERLRSGKPLTRSDTELVGRVRSAVRAAR
jgi:hypothetical protein